MATNKKGSKVKILVGHDEYHQRDFLLTIHDDDPNDVVHTIATRPGRRHTWTTWSAPVTLVADPAGGAE